jgi:hypothetical protein
LNTGRTWQNFTLSLRIFGAISRTFGIRSWPTRVRSEGSRMALWFLPSATCQELLCRRTRANSPPGSFENKGRKAAPLSKTSALLNLLCVKCYGSEALLSNLLPI